MSKLLTLGALVALAAGTVSPAIADCASPTSASSIIRAGSDGPDVLRPNRLRADGASLISS